jgi:hypothetical protein
LLRASTSDPVLCVCCRPQTQHTRRS